MFYTLRQKIFALIFFLLIFPPLIIMGISYFVLSKNIKTLLLPQMQVYAELIEANIILYFEDLKSDAQGVVRSGMLDAIFDVSHGATDDSDNVLEKEISKIADYIEHANGVAVFDGSGKIIASTFSHTTKVEHLSQIALRAVEGELFAIREDAGTGSSDILISIPVFSEDIDNKLLGIFLLSHAGVELEEIIQGKKIQAMGAQTQIRDTTSNVVLQTKAGKVLAKSNSKYSLGFNSISPPMHACFHDDREFLGEWREEDSAVYLGSVMCIKFPGLDLALVVFKNQLVALKPVQELVYNLLALGGVAQCIFIFFALYVVKIIARPVNSLTSVVGRIEMGDHSIRAITNQTDDDINRLALAFNHLLDSLFDAQKKLEEFNARKSEFVSHVSHEIKNPLNTINMALTALADPKLGELGDKQKEMIKISERSIKRLMRLVVDILDLAKIEAGRMDLKLEKVDLFGVLTDVLEDFQNEWEKKKITLQVKSDGIDFSISADRDKIYQVITNLVSNALKYTPESGHVNISLSTVFKKQILTIYNSGAGLGSEEIPKLFDKFERIKKQRAEGTGLGLALVKEIVTLHGGEITVTSVINEGVTFSVQFPAHE